jgi:radical SAM protein with 4Fe4S-binding SPASM domain
VLRTIRGIDKIESIESGVFRLLAAREHASARLPRIGVSFVVQEANQHQRNAFIERWAQCVDCVRIALMFDSSRGTYPDMDTRGLNRIPCPVLYETMPVHNDGSVSICCLDGFKETTVGNIREEGIASVWHGEAFTAIRHYHETQQWDKVPFCAKCNGWAQHIFEETRTSTHLIRTSPQFVYYNRLDRLDNWKREIDA